MGSARSILPPARPADMQHIALRWTVFRHDAEFERFGRVIATLGFAGISAGATDRAHDHGVLLDDLDRARIVLPGLASTAFRSG